MSSIKQQLAVDIAEYLSKCIANGDIPSDEQESLEVAVSCIRESFGVADDAKGGEDLLAIYTAAKEGSATKPTTQAASSAPKPTVAPVSDEDKEAAEQLKVAGNRLMSQRKFNEAVESYTKAIAKNPGNAIYYSNRAAAYSQLDNGQKAVEDGRRAVELDPTYSKAYSRLGLALWSTGDLKGSLEAYESGLKAEGDSPSEAMKRDYATVKKRYEEAQDKSSKTSAAASPSRDSPNPWEKSTDVAASDASRDASGTGAGAGAGAGGDPFGGMGGLGGMAGIANLMKNPGIQQMAQQFMSNPSMMNDIMNSPAAQKVRESFQNGGGMPNMGEMMQDENIQNLMKSFGGPPK